MSISLTTCNQCFGKNLNKPRVGKVIPPDFKASYKATAIKTVWYVQKINEQKRIQKYNRFTHLANWISTKDIHTILRFHKKCQQAYFSSFLRIPIYMQEWEHIHAFPCSKGMYEFSRGSWEQYTISVNP